MSSNKRKTYDIARVSHPQVWDTRDISGETMEVFESALERVRHQDALGRTPYLHG